MQSQKNRRHTDTSNRTNTQGPAAACQKIVSLDYSRSAATQSEAVPQHLHIAFGAVAGCTVQLDALSDGVTVRMFPARAAEAASPQYRAQHDKAEHTERPGPRELRLRLRVDHALRTSFKRAAKRSRTTPREVMVQMIRDYVEHEAQRHEGQPPVPPANHGDASRR